MSIAVRERFRERLEIEIIYALMDCQAENAKSLRASDHTHTRLDLWREGV